MKIHIRHVKEKDLFEFQIVEPSLRAHFLLTRKRLNDLRGIIERAMVETASKKRQDGKQ